MICGFVGKMRKFCSSGDERGVWNRRSPAQRAIITAKMAENTIVVRLRERAEKYEARGDEATPGKSIELNRIAKELRSCATSIRLSDWNDSDEI